MRKLIPAGSGVGLLLAGVLVLVASRGDAAVEATHGNFNVHVHDSYYHPTGAFGVPTNHTLAKAACEAANPDSDCDTVIHVNDTVTWIAPAPIVALPHTVTECTDNTFSVCGASVDPSNPIGDSGTRNPPPATPPSGWPYGAVQFNAVGINYYRCDIHPGTMRGRVLVTLAETTTPLPPAVGGAVGLAGGESAGRDQLGSSGGGSGAGLATALGLAGVVLTGAGVMMMRRRRAG